MELQKLQFMLHIIQLLKMMCSMLQEVILESGFPDLVYTRRLSTTCSIGVDGELYIGGAGLARIFK